MRRFIFGTAGLAVLAALLLLGAHNDTARADPGTTALVAVDMDNSGNTLNTTVTATMDATQTTATVTSTAGFPGFGKVWLFDVTVARSAAGEIVSYTNKTATSFTGLTRGVDGTSGVAHTQFVTAAVELPHTIGTTEKCIALSTAGTPYPSSATIDVIVDDIPAADGMAGYAFTIDFDDSKIALSAASTVPALIGIDPDSGSITDLGGGISSGPGPGSKWDVGVADLGPIGIDTPPFTVDSKSSETGKGILYRVNVAALAGGDHWISFDAADLGNDAGDPIPITTIQDGVVRVNGGACPGDADFGVTQVVTKNTSTVTVSSMTNGVFTVDKTITNAGGKAAGAAKDTLTVDVPTGCQARESDNTGNIVTGPDTLTIVNVTGSIAGGGTDTSISEDIDVHCTEHSQHDFEFNNKVEPNDPLQSDDNDTNDTDGPDSESIISQLNNDVDIASQTAVATLTESDTALGDVLIKSTWADLTVTKVLDNFTGTAVDVNVKTQVNPPDGCEVRYTGAVNDVTVGGADVTGAVAVTDTDVTKTAPYTVTDTADGTNQATPYLDLHFKAAVAAGAGTDTTVVEKFQIHCSSASAVSPFTKTWSVYNLITPDQHVIDADTDEETTTEDVNVINPFNPTWVMTQDENDVPTDGFNNPPTDDDCLSFAGDCEQLHEETHGPADPFASTVKWILPEDTGGDDGYVIASDAEVTNGTKVGEIKGNLAFTISTNCTDTGVNAFGPADLLDTAVGSIPGGVTALLPSGTPHAYYLASGITVTQPTGTETFDAHVVVVDTGTDYEHVRVLGSGSGISTALGDTVYCGTVDIDLLGKDGGGTGGHDAAGGLRLCNMIVIDLVVPVTFIRDDTGGSINDNDTVDCTGTNDSSIEKSDDPVITVDPDFPSQHTVAITVQNGAVGPTPLDVEASIQPHMSDPMSDIPCTVTWVAQGGDTKEDILLGGVSISILNFSTPALAPFATFDASRDYMITCTVPGTYTDLVQIAVNVSDPTFDDPNLLDNQDENQVTVIVTDDFDVDDDTVDNADDNCPTVPNPDQADQDGDDYGDVCDWDRDDDGIGDIAETELIKVAEAASPPNPESSEWKEIRPNHGDRWHLEKWWDNTDGVLSASDLVRMHQLEGKTPSKRVLMHVVSVSSLVLEGIDECPTLPEDFDGDQDTDGCPETDIEIVSVTKEDSLNVKVSEDSMIDARQNEDGSFSDGYGNCRNGVDDGQPVAGADGVDDVLFPNPGDGADADDPDCNITNVEVVIEGSDVDLDVDLEINFLAVSPLGSDQCVVHWIAEDGDVPIEWEAEGNFYSQLTVYWSGVGPGTGPLELDRDYYVHCTMRSTHQWPTNGPEIQIDVMPQGGTVDTDVTNNVHKNYPIYYAWDQADLKVTHQLGEIYPEEGILSGDGWDDDEDCTEDAPGEGANPAWPNNIPFPGACDDGTHAGTFGGVDEDPINMLDDDGDWNVGTDDLGCDGVASADYGEGNTFPTSFLECYMVGVPNCSPMGPTVPCPGEPNVDEDGGAISLVTVDKTFHNNGPVTVPVTLTGTFTIETMFDTMCILINTSSYPYFDYVPGPYPSNQATITPDWGSVAPSVDIVFTEQVGVLCDRPAPADVDDDKDLKFDEDPIDGTDNDGDTLVDEDPGFDMATITIENCADFNVEHVMDSDDSNDCDEIEIEVPVIRNLEKEFEVTHDDDEDPSDPGTAGPDGIPGTGDDIGTAAIDKVCAVQMPCEQLIEFDVGGGDPMGAQVTYTPFEIDVAAGTNVDNGTQVARFDSRLTLQGAIQGDSCRTGGPAAGTLTVGSALDDGALPAAAGEGPDDASVFALLDPNVWPTRLEADGTLGLFMAYLGPPHARYVGLAAAVGVPVNVLVFEDTIGVTGMLGPLGVKDAAATATQGWAHVVILGDPTTPSGTAVCTPWDIDLAYQGEDADENILRACKQEAMGQTVDYHQIYIRQDIMAAQKHTDSSNSCEGGVADVKDVSWTSRDDMATIDGNQVLVTAGVKATVAPAPANINLTDILHSNGPYDPVKVGVTQVVDDFDITKAAVLAPTDFCSVEGDGGAGLLMGNIDDADARDVAKYGTFTLPASVDEVDIFRWVAVWLPNPYDMPWPMPKPPFTCTVTWEKDVSIITADITDPDLSNNDGFVTATIIRDSDGDTVPDNYWGQFSMSLAADWTNYGGAPTFGPCAEVSGTFSIDTPEGTLTGDVVKAAPSVMCESAGPSSHTAQLTLNVTGGTAGVTGALVAGGLVEQKTGGGTMDNLFDDTYTIMGQFAGGLPGYVSGVFEGDIMSFTPTTPEDTATGTLATDGCNPTGGDIVRADGSIDTSGPDLVCEQVAYGGLSGLKDSRHPDHPGDDFGIADNCQDVPNPDQTDTDEDGLGDACDDTPEHDVGVKDNLVVLGPAAINLSDTNGRYMWVIAEIGNFSDHLEQVQISLGLTPEGDLANCDIDDALILPGLSEFLLAEDEQKFVVYRVRFECHTGDGASAGQYNIDVKACIHHINTPAGHGDEDAAHVADVQNCRTITKAVIVE